MLSVRRSALALALFWTSLGAASARDVQAAGSIRELTKDSFTLRMEDGKEITFKFHVGLWKLPLGYERPPLRLLTLNMRISLEYHLEGSTYVCTDYAVVYRVEKGTVQDVYEDGFTLRDENGKLLAFNASDKLRKGEDDKSRDTFTDKFADLKPGQRVRLLYFKDKEALVCAGLQFVK